MAGFDANDYLQVRYGDPSLSDRWKFPLDKLHELFKSLHPAGASQTHGLKVLDFGSGPVVQNSISAVPYASEIVFCDISAPNREAIKKWLRNDPDTFDWSPKFDYVVKTLEGKGEKEAREREELMRKIAKVASCDALSENPMEKGFEGPYDVILECGCLDAACSEAQSYGRCMKVLTSLLKPGGVFAHYTSCADSVKENLSYPVGDKWYGCMAISSEFAVSHLEDIGFTDITVDTVPLDPLSSNAFTRRLLGKEYSKTGYHFISAKKK